MATTKKPKKRLAVWGRAYARAYDAARESGKGTLAAHDLAVKKAEAGKAKRTKQAAKRKKS